MTRTFFVPPALFAIALTAIPLAAQTVTLTADDVLRVHFRVPSPPSPTPDVLSLGLGIVTVTAAHGARIGELYNCGTLLGTATTSSFGSHVGALSLGVANSWRQVGSVYNFDSPGDVADFSSLQNATIEGIIDFRISTGSIDLDLNNVTLRLIRATGASGGSVSSPQPMILEKAIGPRLTGPLPGTSGGMNTWTTESGTPGHLVLHGFGFACSPLLVPSVPPVFYDITPLATVIGVIDPLGKSSVTLPVPVIGSPVTLLTQSVELIGPDLRVSNFVGHTFL